MADAYDLESYAESVQVQVLSSAPLFGPVAQLVRAPACHAGGRRFEPVLGRQKYAEMVEWSIAAVLKTVEARVSGGSNPSLCAKYIPR